MRPFGPEYYPQGERSKAEALWAWFDATDSDAVTDEDPDRIRSGERPVDREIARAWESVKRVGESLGLDQDTLLVRLQHAAAFRGGEGPDSGAEVRPFLHGLVGGHAEALSRAKGYRGSWQRRAAADFAHGLVMIQGLYLAPEWAREGRSLFCRSEMDSAGVTHHDLAGHACPRGYSRLAWKQSIRARDFLAGAIPLILEMGFGDRRHAKRIWLTALEYVFLLERVDFDVWTSKPSLSRVAKMRVGIQSIFGKAAFQRR